jgi:hypothetical protein
MLNRNGCVRHKQKSQIHQTHALLTFKLSQVTPRQHVP